jgi:hypothetical protein
MPIDAVQPCMRVDLRDSKITCGYAKGHTGPCSFGSRTKQASVAAASSVEPEIHQEKV